MRSLRVRFVVAAAASAVSLATCAFFLSAAPASAGQLTFPSLDPTPILSPVTNLLSSPTPLPSIPVVDSLLSPSPTPTVTGVPPLPVVGSLNDTINQVTNTVTGTLGLSSPTNGPVNGGMSGSGGGSGTQTTATGTGTRTATGAATLGSPTGLTAIDGTGVLTSGVTWTSPYGAVTGDAIRHAAERALHLAGPLAPPVLLGCLALAVLLMMSRGSTSLVKIDTAGITGRRWRI